MILQPRPRVVLSGSFHRDSKALRKLFKELETNGCRILAPLSIDFINTNDEFIRAGSDVDYSVEELERAHLRAIKEADLVWLHAPDGYVGLSAAFELGVAYQLGKPLFSHQKPQDPWLGQIVNQINSVFEALYLLSAATD